MTDKLLEKSLECVFLPLLTPRSVREAGSCPPYNVKSPFPCPASHGGLQLAAGVWTEPSRDPPAAGTALLWK